MLQKHVDHTIAQRVVTGLLNWRYQPNLNSHYTILVEQLQIRTGSACAIACTDGPGTQTGVARANQDNIVRAGVVEGSWIACRNPTGIP